MRVVALVVGFAAATAIGPIPVTPNSHPFNSVYQAQTRVDLARSGYVEQEYFISGRANVYQYDADKMHVSIKTLDAPYTTRILLERPLNPNRFSGNVIVDLMNPTLGYDLPIMWQYAHAQFLRNGDVYVGVTVKPIAIAALKRFNSQRYAILSMRNPVPLNRTCSQLPPDSSTQTENGLSWDIVSEVGTLLKQRRLQNNPLFGFPVQKLFATGYSQSASYLVTYVNAIARQGYASLPDGRPIFDGFFIASGDGQIPINQCAPSLSIADSRNVISHAGVPVVRVQSQGDFGFWLGSQTSRIALGNTLHRRPDSDAAGDQFRLYEIAGDSHVTSEQADFAPDARDLSQARQTTTLKDRCNEQPPSDFPAHAFLDAMWLNLELWVRNGVPPPRAARISTLNTGTPLERVAFDQFANAMGGVRSSQLDVPTQTYIPTSSGSSLLCVLQGYVIRFSQTQLTQLYASHSIYVTRVQQTLARLVRDRWLVPADAAEILLGAERSAVP